MTPASTGLDPLAKPRTGSENSVTKGCVGLFGYYFFYRMEKQLQEAGLHKKKKKIQRLKENQTISQEVEAS